MLSGHCFCNEASVQENVLLDNYVAGSVSKKLLCEYQFTFDGILVIQSKYFEDHS